MDDATVALLWLTGAVVAEYTAAQYNKTNSVITGWQKAVYLASWFLFLVYSVAIVGGGLVGIFSEIL